MKRYILIFLKIFIVVFIIAVLFLILEVFGFKWKLMQDKGAESEVDEGKYILTRLASEYEEYLKKKKNELEKEKQDLLKESIVYKTMIEKKKIEARLREIEIEKKIISDEIKKSAEESKEIEARILNFKEEQEEFSRAITELNEDYLKLLDEKEKAEAYWKGYAEDLLVFFIDKNKKDSQKKALIEEQFKVDNGKQFIIDEFRNLAKFKNIEQTKNIFDKKLSKLETIDKTKETVKTESKDTVKPETIDKIKDYKTFSEKAEDPYTTDSKIIISFAYPILKKIENRSPDFIDDFSSNTGWDFRGNGKPLELDELSYRLIKDGSLKIFPGVDKLYKDNKRSITISNPKTFYKNFVLKIDIKPEKNNSQGEILFYNSWNNIFPLYQIVIHQDYIYFICKYSESKQYVKEILTNKQGFIQLALIVYKNYIAVYINNKPGCFYYNKELTQGKVISIGGYLHFDSNLPVHAATFDNLQIWDLDKVL
ncbi:MAG: hypothetical protein JW924_10680 [Fusobacteriaceae bacterium]|nr:hypothetical protein [Fusobacteriaceae bacterium]